MMVYDNPYKTGSIIPYIRQTTRVFFIAQMLQATLRSKASPSKMAVTARRAKPASMVLAWCLVTAQRQQIECLYCFVGCVFVGVKEII